MSTCLQRCPISAISTIFALLAVSFTLGVSCSGSAVFDVGGELCVGSACDVGRDGRAERDVVLMKDTPSLSDLTTTDLGPLDSGALDAPLPEDTAPDVTAGGFGWPCTSNGDCTSGYCVEDPATGSSVCTDFCITECPGDWDCRVIGYQGPDVVSICVPPVNRLCEPCETDVDCVNPTDRCVPIGEDPDEPTFCAKGCDPGGGCPAGYTCTELTDDDGAFLAEQCLPDTGSCVCTAELDGTTRPCERSNAAGTCGGVELCDGPRGWNGCTAREPAPELCNGEDDDCDGLFDEDFAFDPGDGEAITVGERCGVGVCAGGTVVCADDVSATCSGLQLRTDEVCNELDDDCDGETDEEVGTIFFRDVDGDGQGWPALSVVGCAPPEGYVANSDDCDDYDRAIGLGFPELCDSRDNDCDGETDEDFVFTSLEGVEEAVGDPCGVGLCAGGVVVCAGADDVVCSTSTYARAETCDDRDEDCDGVTDNTCDDDEDGYCDASIVVAGAPAVCPEGAGDCDDDDADVHPDADERCDGVDEDCDGETDEDVVDCIGGGCTGGGEDYFETSAAACVDSECVAADPRGCGLFTCSEGGADGDLCAEACAADSTCVPSAHCDERTALCVVDVQDGGPCVEDGDCVSSHCQNGYCCSAGDCCSGADDCSEDYAVAPVCDDPVACQGHRNVQQCVDHVCQRGPDEEDDSGCDAGVLAVDCTPGIPLYCSGAVAQDAPECSDICVSDEGCVDGYHCDDFCVPDLDDGAPCDELSDCVSGYCANGFCCADGDCCAAADDCPAEYREAPICDDVSQCSGHRVDAVCSDSSTCRSTEPLDDDSGCTTSMVANDCGFYKPVYCSGDFNQRPYDCATSCDVDEMCDPGAHCDGECLADLPDGSGCDEDSDCTSDHCRNGFCCGGGECCAVSGDCPAEFSVAPVCETPSACQGFRVDPTCDDFVCGTTGHLDDDTACDVSVVADACGPYVDVTCTGLGDQREPLCPSACMVDEECDADAHCDDVCLLDLDGGEACDEASDCISGYCNNGFCCVEGDCCSEPGDCPSSYSAPSVCDDPSSCQGFAVAATCNDHRCGSQNLDDDSACTVAVLSDGCGLFLSVFCDGSADQPDPPCAISCGSDDDCDPEGHCAGGVCVPDSGAGGVCDTDSDCETAHCQNGHCCAAGDCCASATDCPAGYSAPAVCEDAASCQGQRTDAACIEFQCVAHPTDDDSACDAGVLSDDCGLYPAVFCTGSSSQSDPVCPSTCSADIQCDSGAHCDAGRCAADLDVGGSCDETSDCVGGLYCVDEVCCTSTCGGTCRRCDLPGSVGVCSSIGAGEDPDEECGGLSCTGFFWGWVGDSCYRTENAGADDVTCNGRGGCYAANDVCPSMDQGALDLSCHPDCQEPMAGRCTGSIAGACSNVNPGNETCGTGICETTVPLCVNGEPTACVPLLPRSETCNNLDDDCNAVVDDNVSGAVDGYEWNGACSSPKNFGNIQEGSSEQSWSATLYPAGDVDWYRFTAKENSDACVPFTSESLGVRVRLVPPGGGDCRDYDVYLYDDSCGDESAWLARGFNSGCAAENITFDWQGTCGFNDDRTFRVKVEAWGGAWECISYALYIDVY